MELALAFVEEMVVMLLLFIGVIHGSCGSRKPLLGDRRRGKTRWIRGLNVMMQAHEMAVLTSSVVQKIMLAQV